MVGCLFFMDMNVYCIGLIEWIHDMRENNSDQKDHSNHCGSANNFNQIMNLQSDGSYCHEKKTSVRCVRYLNELLCVGINRL